MSIGPLPVTLRPLIAILAGVIALLSAGCVQSEKPLLSDARPLMGETFEAHFFEDFVDGKASLAHTANYRWTEGHYVLVRGSNDRVSSFTSVVLENDAFLVEGKIKETADFNYWVARKVVDGVFLIVPVNESDSDDATRAAACTGKRVDGFCFVENKQELFTLARATASKAPRNPTLGVLVLRRNGS